MFSGFGSFFDAIGDIFGGIFMSILQVLFH